MTQTEDLKLVEVLLHGHMIKRLGAWLSSLTALSGEKHIIEDEHVLPIFNYCSYVGSGKIDMWEA